MSHSFHVFIVCFRQKAGIWGFRSDRNEVVDSHNAKVESVK